MRRIWVMGLWAAVACGGRAASEERTSDGTAISEPQGGTKTRGGSDDWREPAQEETPPIPPFPDLCSRFEIVRSPRVGLEPYLTCPCGGGPVKLCDASSCVTSLSCDALCAGSVDTRAPGLFECAGDCDVNDDGPTPCLQLPGAAGGSYLTGPWCFEDEHCGTDEHCVAVTSDGLRACSRNVECNEQDDCRPGQRCALPDDSFVGFCGDGRDASICFSDADCRENARCVLGVDTTRPLEQGLCSSGVHAAPCVKDGDCAGSLCRGSKCSVGQVYDACFTTADCQPGLHCQNWGVTYDPDFALCSHGSISSSCLDDGDCAEGLYCGGGLCEDGADESYCASDEQCLSGRCQLAGSGPTCTGGAANSRCMDAGDCESGSCTRGPSTPDWDFGLCD